MTIFDELAQIMLEGLKLWNSKESTKYQDHILSLREKRRAEERKPSLDEIAPDQRAGFPEGDLRSDAVLDDLLAELRDTWAAATAEAGKAAAAPVQG